MRKMPRKKILHIITKGSPYGGAQKYVYELATSLPTDQFESVVLVGAGDELPLKLQSENIRVIQLPELGRDVNVIKEFKVFWQLVTILKSEKPDIVHLNSSKIGGLGALAARVARIPHILFTAHGWAFNEKRSKLSVTAIRFASWITMLLVHKTIVIARNDEVQAMNMPFVRHKVKLIYNGIGPIDFKNKTEARTLLSERIRIGNAKKIWIGCVAELHKNKNLETAIRAMEYFRGKIIFTVIGEGEERANLERCIRENRMEESVFLVGKVEGAASYLKAFDIFILPSVKEGLPYTLLEAGLAGLPCLSTYVGGIPEIMRNNISGVLADPTTEKIRAGLEFLINNPDKAKEFGRVLKEKVQKDFSIKRMVEETIKVYEK